MRPHLITLLCTVIAPLSYGATVNSSPPNDVGAIELCDVSNQFSFYRTGAETVKIYLSSQGGPPGRPQG